MNKKDILERLDKYREIEIKNLWQRSLFLGTFLILGFTSYGVLIEKTLSVTTEGGRIEDLVTILFANRNLKIDFYACCLAMINIVFSILWIAMAKGSKAWYEAYENAIYSIENDLTKDLSWKNIRLEIDLRRRKDEEESCNEDRDDKESFHTDLKKNCWFLTSAGGYSPSKINIFLGQLFFGVWFFVLIFHVIKIFNLNFLATGYICITLSFYLVMVGNLIFNSTIKSSYFKGKCKFAFCKTIKKLFKKKNGSSAKVGEEDE